MSETNYVPMAFNGQQIFRSEKQVDFLQMKNMADGWQVPHLDDLFHVVRKNNTAADFILYPLKGKDVLTTIHYVKDSYFKSVEEGITTTGRTYIVGKAIRTAQGTRRLFYKVRLVETYGMDSLMEITPQTIFLSSEKKEMMEKVRQQALKGQPTLPLTPSPSTSRRLVIPEELATA